MNTNHKIQIKIKVEIEIGIKNDNPKKISSIQVNLIDSISNVNQKAMVTVIKKLNTNYTIKLKVEIDIKNDNQKNQLHFNQFNRIN